MTAIVLLGPQRLQPTLATAVAEVGGAVGPFAAVTAGWEEREDEIDELRAHLDRPVVNLRLHRRAEEVFARDREFFRAYRERRARLRELQELYRIRLDPMKRAVRKLWRRRGTPDLVDPEREAALADVRALDAHQLARIADLHREFEETWRPGERDAVVAHRREVATLADDCVAFAFAGGNVAVLLNRLRLFGVAALLGDRPLFAWSAGAMAASEQVVLFHDTPPQGPGNPEVFGAGLGLCHGILPLPHARRRLRLDDPVRVAIFAGRFAPLCSVAFDDGAALLWDGARWTPLVPGTRRLTREGDLVETVAA